MDATDSSSDGVHIFDGEQSTMDELVKALPKDGTPVMILPGVEAQYIGEFGYNESWDQ